MVNYGDGILLSYDTSICEKLRDKVNEKVNIMILKKDTIHNKKNNTEVNYDAWNRICACMDRISDTLDYLNGMTLGKCRSSRAAFDFYDFINCSSVIIECIESLCHIFNVDKRYLSFCEERKIFGDILGNLGSDEKFFKYIRSLAVVHPSKTNGKHPYILGSIVVQCSPFVTWYSKYNAFTKKENYDLQLVVYSSRNEDKTKWIPLSISQFDEYLSRWLDLINDIIDAVDKYNDSYFDHYRSIPMKTKKEFNNMVDYICYLKEENKKRLNNEFDYIFDKYYYIFTVNLSSKKNQEKLNKYRNAIEYSIDFEAKSLQDMTFEGFEYTGIAIESPSIETTLFLELEHCYSYNSILGKHHYNISKAYMLNPSSPYSYYDKIYARDLIKEIIPVLSEYIDITGNEPDVELMVLIDLVLYLDSLKNKSVTNRNIPNDLKYREKLLTDDELREVASEDKIEPVKIVDEDGNEIDILELISKYK